MRSVAIQYEPRAPLVCPRPSPRKGNLIVNRLSIATATAAATVTAIVLSASTAFAAPDPTPGLPGGVEAKLNLLLGMAMSFVIAACVGGVLLCAGKLALAMRHGEAGEAAGKLVAVGVACILVMSGAGIVNYLT